MHSYFLWLVQLKQKNENRSSLNVVNVSQLLSRIHKNKLDDKTMLKIARKKTGNNEIITIIEW